VGHTTLVSGDGPLVVGQGPVRNALVAAETMVGRDGITAHALPHDRLTAVMGRYGRNLESSRGV
jgi:D-aminopeptidase